MSQLRPRFAITIASLSLSAAVAFASANAVAQQPEHAHSADHSAGHGQQVATNNPAAQRKAAIESTESFINAHKQWAQAKGAANKAAALEKLIARAEARQAMLTELARTNPVEALTIAIPEEKQIGMPPAVLEKLEQRFASSGELEVLYADFADGSHELRHYLNTPFGERFRLNFAGHPAQFMQGDNVSIDGVLLSTEDESGNSDGNIVLAADDTGIQTLALDGSGNGGEPGPVANSLGEQRTLVMLVNFQDDSSQPWSQAQISSLVKGKVNDFMVENSYGQTWLNSDVTNWMTISASKSGCPTGTYSSLANQKAQQFGYNPANYDRLIYLWPQNSSCGFSGLGTVGGAPSKSWINGQYLWNIFAHELGHNFGLGHSHDLNCGSSTLGSNCSVTEYGDFTDTMGAGFNGHFNAFQKDRLGWLGYGSAPELTTVTSNGNYTISPYEDQNGSAKALKILKDTDPSTGENSWYYLEYRQAKGFDSGLSGYGTQINFLNGVTVHSGNKSNANSSYLLDMTPGSSGSFYDAALEEGYGYNDSSAGVSFNTTWLDGNSAQISVNLNQQSCISNSPTLTAVSSESAWVEAGTAVTYSLILTNRDSSACASSSFNLAAIQPSGWNSSLSHNSLNLAPGTSTTIHLTVTSSSSAVDGFYDIVTSASKGSQTASTTVTYVVSNPASNTAPVANNDSASTIAGNSVSINVLSNDSDADGDSLTISSVSGVNGSATISGSNIIFTPSAGFNGTENFSYSISDGKGGSANASVSVSVSPAPSSNSAPIAVNDGAAVAKGSSVTISVLNNDSDPDGDNLILTGASEGNKGSVIVHSNGTLTYTPAKSFKNGDSFSYSISDGKKSATATVSISLLSDGSGGGSGGGKGNGKKR
ncbi:Ig-like domain-containing protein [Amphritea balenae]|nr:Ig-like domain-containing protein [Amphritea balenae]GGK84908.1 peptidase M11 [Amphritea balenae]